MPPKNIESCQLYVQTPEGYEPLAIIESAEVTSLADAENVIEKFAAHIEAAITLMRSGLKDIIQILYGNIEPYKMNEMLHPKKKPRGSLRRKRKEGYNDRDR